MSEYSIYISLLSFIIAGVTLYLTQLRPPKFEIHYGQKLRINYQSNGTGAAFYIPITFINLSHSTGTVFKCSVAISRVDTPQQIFYMEWKEFRKLNVEKNLWVYEDMAHPIPISGRSSVNKICWFVWESEPKFLFKEGTYKFQFFSWSSSDAKPDRHTEHELFISEAISTRLSNYKSKKKSTLVEVGFDKTIDANKLMTPHEVENLLSF